ncbi:pyridoxal phosphate-dependent aminotransferase [Litoribacter populi]|uniref:pyridoxal phosphate-dependent aminotransferase n=1 Tax=Litoribacter populi TaxID=2598460 RepID=UPI001180EB09|nr:histidinol-phosphate transaminase [Litoribacter populi]
MKFNRRQWLRSAALTGGASFISGLGIIPQLSAEEISKFNPRPLNELARLSSNENPYGPSKRVRDRMFKSFDDGCRYPYSYQNELLDKLAEREGVPKDHIVITGGSTEALKVAGITFTRNGGEIIASKPTFLAMMSYAQMWGADVNWVDVDENLQHDLTEMQKRISPATKMVFLCNPNNPTGTLLPAAAFEKFCRETSKHTTVFSDEAYFEFIEEPNYPSMVKLVKEGENVIVSRTFSKVFGLAGLRIGYIVARPDLAHKIRENVVAFTNVLALEAAKESLDDKEFFDFSLRKNKEAKDSIYQTLNDLNLRYLESHTNFVFFESGMHIDQFLQKMRDEGVMVGREFPPFSKWCRISTGTPNEMERFTKAIRSVYV